MISRPFVLLSALFATLSTSSAFPNHGHSLKRQEFKDASAGTGAKLVHDPAHPLMPLRDGDERGPCPGMNTLASHGCISSDGVASPSKMVIAAQEGLNVENKFAVFVTYLNHLMNGNLVTDLLSIGDKTSKTGPDPPAPAHAGGLNVHRTFEGDAGMTRADTFFGDNHSFNQTLFDEVRWMRSLFIFMDQFIDFSNRFGDGFYNLTVAGELRFQRLQDSIATNPEFSFKNVRYFTADGESVFPINFFVDGRQTEKKLDMDSARSFFEEMKFLPDLFRSAMPMSNQGRADIFRMHPFLPGGNVDGKVNNFAVDPASETFETPCVLYDDILMTVKGLYPTRWGC
ncbi:heme-thiolate peroxidase, partial [Candolleomyces eurysporus]